MQLEEDRVTRFCHCRVCHLEPLKIGIRTEIRASYGLYGSHDLARDLLGSKPQFCSCAQRGSAFGADSH